MASNHTTNYQLCQWEAADKVLRTDFNEDNAKIDTALKANADAISAEAAARAAAVSSLSQEIAQMGNCRIVTGSYTGNGTYDQYHKNSLTFPAVPLMVFIHGDRNCWMIYGSEIASVDGGSTGGFAQISWSGNTVSWYGDSDYDHLNVAGVTYRYTALIVTE